MHKLKYFLDKDDDVIYGAKSPGMLLYRKELVCKDGPIFTLE